MITKPILVIDGLNFFLRHFMVNETVTAGGEMVGGVVGFVRGVGKLISQLHPDRVFVVWEQGGASPRRKHIYPDYKANRATSKGLQEMYRSDGKFNPNSNAKNKVFQLQLLAKALGHLPICQVYVQDTEADDVVAYLVKRKFQTDAATKIVVSNDKDFYQLLEDPNVRIYDPARKILIDSDYVLKNFGVSPRNITLARSVIGDASDNLDGVPGVGFKTLATRFKDFAREDVDLDQAWLMETAESHTKASKKPLKCFGDIVSHASVVARNWQLMHLDTSCLAASQISKVDFRVENFETVSDKLGFIKTFTAADIPLTTDLDFTFSVAKTLVRQS
jgi:5'-3' exonuclease